MVVSSEKVIGNHAKVENYVSFFVGRNDRGT